MSSKSSFYTDSAVTNTQSVAIEASVGNAEASANSASNSATAAANSASSASASAATATTSKDAAVVAKDAAVVAKNAAEAAAIVLSGSTMTGDLDFGDDIKAKFGDSDDLRVFHSAGNSFVQDAGAGDLFIAGSNAVRITNSDASEAYAAFNSNSGVDLYHDNTLRFQTSSTGISVAGNVFVTGTVDGRDVLVDGTKLDTIESNADVTNTANVVASLTAGTNITIASDGTIASTGSGGSSYGDNDKAIFGAGSDLQIYHDGNNRLVTSGDLLVNITDGDEFQVLGSSTAVLRATATGSVRLFHNGSEKLATTSTGIDVTGNVTTNDVNITDTTPNLKFTDTDGNHLANITQSGSHLYIDNDSTGLIRMRVDGNTERFTVNSTGVNVTGNVAVSGTVDGRDIATNIPSSLGTAGQVLTVNAGATAGEWADAGGGGITTGKSIAMAMVFG